MPNRWPISSGNWSNSAIWSGSLIPTASDDVYANNQSVYVDTDIIVRSLQSGTITGVTNGGTYYLNNGITATVTSLILPGNSTTGMIIISGSNSATISCPVMSNVGFNHTAIILTGSANLTYTGSINSPAGGNGTGLIHSSTGTLNVLGNVFVYAQNGSNGIVFNRGGTLNIIGNISGGGLATAYAVIQSTTGGTINITGNLTGGVVNSFALLLSNNNIVNINGNLTSAGAPALLVNGGTSTITITGSLLGTNAPALQDINAATSMTITVSGSVTTADTATAAAFYKLTTGTIRILGPISAGINFPGLFISNNVPSVFLTGPFYNKNNRNAVYAPIFQLLSGSTPTWTFDTETYAEQRTLYTQNYPGNFPSTSNVRQGTIFGDTNQFTGTVAIPPTGSVLKGVPVDNVTGSASFTTQNVWNTSTSSLTASNSLGARLSNTATVASDGILIALTGSL
jgi:hypothetical protein